MADIVDARASQTSHRDFEAWAPSTQIPIQVNARDDHSYSHMPLVEAPRDGCGRDLGRSTISSRVLSSLDVENEVVDAAGKAVFGYIDAYPEFYNLTGIGYALPIGGRHVAAYDAARNDASSVLGRIEAWEAVEMREDAWPLAGAGPEVPSTAWRASIPMPLFIKFLT